MKNVLQYLELSTEKNKEKIAIIEEEKSISYNDLLKNSKRIGTVLSNYIDLRNPVGVLMEKGIDSLVSFFRNSICRWILCVFKFRFTSCKT